MNIFFCTIKLNENTPDDISNTQQLALKPLNTSMTRHKHYDFFFFIIGVLRYKQVLIEETTNFQMTITTSINYMKNQRKTIGNEKKQSPTGKLSILTLFCYHLFVCLTVAHAMNMSNRVFVSKRTFVVYFCMYLRKYFRRCMHT